MGCGICSGYDWDLCPVHGGASCITAESVRVATESLRPYMADSSFDLLSRAFDNMIAAQDIRDLRATLSDDATRIDDIARAEIVAILRAANEWEKEVNTAEPGVIAHHDYRPLTIGGPVRKSMLPYPRTNHGISYFFGVETYAGGGLLHFSASTADGVRYMPRSDISKAPGGLFMIRVCPILSISFDRFNVDGETDEAGEYMYADDPNVGDPAPVSSDYPPPPPSE